MVKISEFLEFNKTPQQRLDALQKELDEIKKQISSKHEFAKGWNYFECRFNWLVLNPKIEDGQVKIDLCIDLKNYKTDKGFMCDDSDEYTHRPATPEEIKIALTEVCKRKGIVPGAYVKRPENYIKKNENGHTVKDHVKIYHHEYFYHIEDDSLVIDSTTVYYQGQFATVVKEEEIKIGGYEVKFHLVGQAGYDGSKTLVAHTSISGYDFSKEFWQAAKLISEHSKAKIMVGCSKQFDVSLDTINAILKRLEK